MASLQVRHVADRLHRDFDGQLDLSDLAKRPEQERELAFLSRALTAMALQSLANLDVQQAVAGVIDGQDDNGIDGIAVDEDIPHLWIVQTKWSDKGRASLDQAGALKLQRGVALLRDGYYEEFNTRFQKIAESVAEAINTAGVKITIVVALLGEPVVSPVVWADLERLLAQLNEPEPLAELKILGFRNFYQIVRDGIAAPKIDLDVRLESYGQLFEPYRAFYGTVSAADVAAWYAAHGDVLFTQNIRRSLGLTDVNRRLQQTLREQPQNFWYFNNGITVLCDSVRKTQFGTTNAAGDFSLTGATVVNGAQTVYAIHEAVRQEPETAAGGRVWARLISLEDCPPDFATAVTEATNTQNRVEPRDFAALDPNQARLRDDLALSLHKSYVFKRGEKDPDPGLGCSILEAARALACLHRDPGYVARAKQDSDVLWETGPQGTYHVLFGGPPGAYRVWRCVEVLRAVRERLVEEQTRRQGRAATVAGHADLLVTHLVFRQLDVGRIDDPVVDWGEELAKVPSLVVPILDRLIHYVDTTYGSGSFLAPTFRNVGRCTELAGLVFRDLMAGAGTPTLPQAYRPQMPEGRERRENAVSLLVDAGRIDPGTRLEFRPVTGPERKVVVRWIAADPRRGEATWVNNRGKPLLWAADGERYSPSGLAKKILNDAGLKTRAVQGPTRWYISGEGSLGDLAEQLRD